MRSGAPGGTAGTGGDVSLTASAGGSSTGDGGDVTISAGNSNDVPGFVDINGGVSLGAQDGGAITANAGGSSSGTGGAFTATAGNSTTGAGGNASITAGAGATAGGDVLITAGDATTAAGDVQLRPGGDGNANSGVVVVTPLETTQNAVIRAGTSSRDLYVGGIPTSSAAFGAAVVHRTPAVVTAADDPVSVVAGSVNRADITAGGTLDLVLPDPATCAGIFTFVYKIDLSANDFTVSTPAGTIYIEDNNGASVSINPLLAAERRLMMLWSDGSDYYSIPRVL
jgi:hypothetical protein